MNKIKISEDFYRNIYPYAESVFLDQKVGDFTLSQLLKKVEKIISDRDPIKGLDADSVAFLLHLVRTKPYAEIRDTVIQAARALRKKCFGDQVATMVPIEVTSYCASTCRFCGWRADNKDMVRLAITETAIREQAKILAKMGFSHFEIAGGDHLPFIRNDLKKLISALKQETQEVNPDSRVSLCLVPMHEEHYADLKESGLDCVLTWQETYKNDLYQYHIPSGPKAWGIDSNIKLTKGGDGFMQRLQSQEMAIRNGLQAGLGAMIGLADCAEADILSVVLHGQKLLDYYGDDVQPLIIGMPAWNSLTTAESDNKALLSSNFDVNANIELVAAIYLLSFPDQRAWVFANGRVAPEIQTDCVTTASCFTSTLVQIAPGAYLGLDEAAINEKFDKTSLFSKSSVNVEDLTQETVLSGEQFVHYLMSHDEFINMFQSRGLHVVSDENLLKQKIGKLVA